MFLWQFSAADLGNCLLRQNSQPGISRFFLIQAAGVETVFLAECQLWKFTLPRSSLFAPPRPASSLCCPWKFELPFQ